MSNVSLSERSTRVTRRMKTANAAFSKSVSCSYIIIMYSKIGREGGRVICTDILLCISVLVCVHIDVM